MSLEEIVRNIFLCVTRESQNLDNNIMVFTFKKPLADDLLLNKKAQGMW